MLLQEQSCDVPAFTPNDTHTKPKEQVVLTSKQALAILKRY
jgi:hypothetical protein